MLGRQEVDRLIQCTANLKHRTFLMTFYSAGLRFSEAAALRIHDIDSARMQIRVASGKGRKERLVASENKCPLPSTRPSSCVGGVFLFSPNN